MFAAILAGGLATRMRPLTEKTPKVLLEVGGRPFADWLVEALARDGYRELLFLVGYLGEQVERHLGDGARFGLRITYAYEGPVLLGTAGALRAARALLPERFLVTYGDSYLPFDYGEPLRVLESHDDCDGVMSVYPNHGQFDASNVRTDGSWVLAYEKGTRDPAFDNIDYGAIALTRQALARVPDGPSGLDVLQTALAREHRMRAVVASKRFFEIGSPSGLAELSSLLREQGRV
jgi:NDP-sugar pyrophosphorylase family protein